MSLEEHISVLVLPQMRALSSPKELTALFSFLKDATSFSLHERRIKESTQSLKLSLRAYRAAMVP